MSALRALLAAMPDICRAMNEIDHRWQDRAFDALVNAALTDAQQPSGSYGGSHTGYDPATTSLMTPVRGDGYDPLTSR